MRSRTKTMTTHIVAAGALALAGSIAALAACVGEDPQLPASSSSSSGNGSSGASSSGASSSGASSSGASSSGASSSGASSSGDIDAGPKFLTGKLDTSFKNGARTDVVITTAVGVAIDRKGRTYVYGGAQGCVGGNSDFAVARFLVNGDLDTTFGNTGRACVEFASNNADEAYGLAFDDQNRIVVVGFTGNSIQPNIAVARFTELGQLDTGNFNAPAGKITFVDPGNFFAFSVVVDGYSVLPTIPSPQKSSCYRRPVGAARSRFTASSELQAVAQQLSQTVIRASYAVSPASSPRCASVVVS